MAQFNVNLAFSADTGKAKAQIQELQLLLNKIAYTGSTKTSLTTGIEEAATAAKQLQFHLNNAFNATTGKFDLSLLDRSLKTSNSSIRDLSLSLLNAGTDGQQAFLKLAQSISLADQPMLRISNRMKEFGVTLKNTIKWQLSSSMMHGFIGSIQSAYGYAKDLNKSLNDIRIVTGYNTDQMAEFAEQANKAAKNLSTTTTDYTKASLIYFQQGLSDAEVTERTDVTIKMANAAGQSAQIVSDQLTAVWNNFDNGTKSLEYYADVMTALGAATATSTDEISQGLSKFAAVAETVGLSYEYATAALTTITSNTRESADVVGNALKTLFARLQGLKLGETLEDGVDLNKYSEALDKAGISIFQSNGELKAMDNILTELAGKWDTMNNSQQVALAQTVAGVRQYTQLIALMDNWDSGDSDSMMANLETISGSQGALDKQADIYAQSWEAAEKRVKASAESIYQSLLDDKFFISLNNGFANILTGIDSFIDGLGGVKPLITSIASLFLSNFAHKIPQALDNLKYNLQILIPKKGVDNAYAIMSKQMQEVEKEAFSSGIIDKNSSLGIAIKEANRLTVARNQLALVSDKMSESEKQLANMQLSIIQQAQDEVVALTKKGEVLQKNIEIERQAVMSSMDYFNSYDLGEAKGSKLIDKVDIGALGLKDFDGMGNLGGSIAAEISNNVLPLLKEAGSGIDSLKQKWGNVNSMLGTDFQSSFKDIEKSIQDVNKENFDNVKQQLLSFLKVLPSGVRDCENIKKALQALRNVQGPDDLKTSFTNLKTKLNDTIPSLEEMEKILASIHGDKIHTLFNHMREYSNTTEEAKNKTSELDRIIKQFQPNHLVRMSEAFGALGGLAGNVSTAIRSIGSALSALTNPNLSGWEKFTTVLMSFSMLLPTITAGIKSFSTLQKFFNDNIAAANAGILAEVAALQLKHKISTKNNIVDGASVIITNKKASEVLELNGQLLAETIMTEKLKGTEDKEIVSKITSMLIEEGVSKKVAQTTAAKLVQTITTEGLTKATWKQVAAQMGLNVALLPYIAAIAAVAGIVIGLVNHYKKMAENARENAEVARENAAATKEQVDSNQKLLDSYQETLNNYNKVKEAFDNGQATTEELTNAQNSLADSAFEVATALGVEGAALAKLSGNYDQLNKDIINAQKNNIMNAINDETVAKNATGQEFIYDMRDGVGLYNGTSYHARMGSGWDTSDESYFNKINYGKYNYLDMSGGALHIDSGYNVEQMIAAYEEAQSIYQDAMSKMTAEEMSNSEIFNNLKNWLEKSSESYQAYKDSESNIQNYEIQSASLSAFEGIDNMYDISSIEEYDKYTSAMIQNIATTKNISEGSEEWKQLTEAVYAYLGAVEGVSEFATQSEAFKDISEQTGILKENLLNYYENELKTDEEKELFFQIAFNRVDDINELEKEMELLQSIADGNNLQMKIDIVSEGISLLNDNDTTTQDIVAWAKQMQEAYGDAFNLEEFLAKSSSEQLADLRNLQSQAEMDQTENRESQIAEYQEAIARAKEDMAEQTADFTQAGNDRAINQARLDQLNQYKTDYNQAISQGQSFSFSELGEAGITNIDQLNNAITATQELIAGNDRTINSYNELQSQVNNYEQAINDLELEQQVEDAYGWRDALQEQAEALDINYDEVKEYAAQLRKTIPELTNNIKLSEKLALTNKRLEKGIKGVNEDWEDFAKMMKIVNGDFSKLDKTSPDVNENLDNMRENLANILDVDISQVSDDLIEAAWASGELKGIMEGNAQALLDFQKRAAEAILIEVGIKDEEVVSSFQGLTSYLQSMADMNPIEAHAQLNDAEFLNACENMINAAGMTVQQAQSYFDSLGYEAEITKEPHTTSTTTNWQVPEFIMAPNGDITFGVEGGTTTTTTTTEVLRIKSINKKSGGGSGLASNKNNNKGGGGGGSGQAPKHAEKKSDSEKTRYHTIQNQLEDLNAEYDKLSEIKDRAFGQEKLDNMDAEIEKTDELIKKQEEYLHAIEQNLPVDKAVMEAYYQDTIGGPAMKFDERGNISNYDEIQDAMFNKYNAMTAHDEESLEWQTFEKKYEQLEKYIEQYEETYDLLRDEETAYQELLNQRIDLELEKVQYKVELELAIPEDEIALIEYQLGRIDEDAFKSAESIELLTRQAEALYDQIQINKQGLNDALSLSLSAAEIVQVLAGDTSVLDGKVFTEEQIDAIKEYRDNLLDLNEEFDDIRESIEEQVMEVFDTWNEKLQEGTETLEHYGSILESYKNIVDIVGKDTLGLSNKFMEDLDKAAVDNSINEVLAAKDAYDSMLETQKAAQEALEDARVRNDEASIQMWEENLRTINEESRSMQEELLSKWEDALDTIATMFESTVERVIEAFNESIYALGGLEGLSEEFSRQQEIADILVDDYKKIYELSKLNRDINKAIDDTELIGGKQKLKKLLQEINKLQEDGVEMSEYDLEYLQKTFDLRMAELELEEAQRAKNTVRLSKDNEGNWSYIYTQNTDAVDAAQQKYEDALYAMQDLSSNYINEMSEQLISASQEMAEALAEIRIQDYASIDDYYAEVERVQQQYQDELAMQESELQKAIDNNKQLYDEDWTNYHAATGYKISDTEDFVTTFKDSMLGSMLDSESATANFTDILTEATETLTAGLMTGAMDYYIALEEAMNAAGTSTGDFATDTSKNIDQIVEKSKEGAEAVDQMALEMQDALGAVIDTVSTWQETYGTAMQNIIDVNLEVIKSFNDMLEALSVGGNTTVTVDYNIENSPESILNPSQFDTGGYTGTWGNTGKLAILHEKELILDPKDTVNMLNALKISKSMLDTIELNAQQASRGIGYTTPTVIKEDNTQTLEQMVHITAEFPYATDHNEIQEAIKNLTNTASQYANRK